MKEELEQIFRPNPNYYTTPLLWTFVVESLDLIKQKKWAIDELNE